MCRTPDLAPLSDEFMGDIYDEIEVNEIKMEGAPESSLDTTTPTTATESPTPLRRKKRRNSISDMFSPKTSDLTTEEQKQSFAELGQKMFDVQQRGIKGCPKKVQLGELTSLQGV